MNVSIITKNVSNVNVSIVTPECLKHESIVTARSSSVVKMKLTVSLKERKDECLEKPATVSEAMEYDISSA